MVIITGIYVVATIVISKANITSAKAAQNQVLESRRQFEERKRLEQMPYLDISINEYVTELNDDGLQLVISSRNCPESTVFDLQMKLKNIGLGTAKDFQYQWTNLDGSYLRDDLSFTACLPGEEKTIPIDFFFEYSENTSPYEATVHITFQYKDLLENQYQQDVSFSFLFVGNSQVEMKKRLLAHQCIYKDNIERENYGLTRRNHHLSSRRRHDKDRRSL